MASPLFVTAFCDIGRGSWANEHSEWTRSADTYINWFMNMVHIPGIKILCFCEPNIADIIRSRLPPPSPSSAPRLTICDLDAPNTNFSNYDTEARIMGSQYFKDLLACRRQGNTNPEFSKPGYNCITNSKPIFLLRATKIFPEHSHYIWADFGLIRNPQGPFPRLLDACDDRINIASFLSTWQPMDALASLRADVNIIQGGLFVVPKGLVGWYHDVYRDTIQQFYDAGITDDDQGIALQIIQKYPYNFHLHFCPHWFAMVRFLSGIAN